VTVAPEIGVDTTRPGARVTFAEARVPAEARLVDVGADDGDGAAALAAIHMRSYALLAAEMLGGAEAVLGRTRDYANERIQFDRPIGAFQAVKHPLVNVMMGVERVRTLVAAAAAALDADPAHAEAPARMAKAAATDLYTFAVGRGVQLHGGFGFTWDCDIHYYFKRALHSAATLGDAKHHRQRLANLLLDG
jgi:alkylation response protein AidB-like acyl-CoA dehydrogenase